MNSKKLNNVYRYQELFDSIKNIELIYVDHFRNYSTRNFIKIDYDNHQYKKNFDRRKNIDNYFYEGFGVI